MIVLDGLCTAPEPGTGSKLISGGMGHDRVEAGATQAELEAVGFAFSSIEEFVVRAPETLLVSAEVYAYMACRVRVGASELLDDAQLVSANLMAVQAAAESMVWAGLVADRSLVGTMKVRTDALTSAITE